MRNVKKVVFEIVEEFAVLIGRKYGFFEVYKFDDVEVVIVVMNLIVGIVKVVVDEYRSKGYKVGFLKLRFFRLFFVDEIVGVFKYLKVVVIMDKLDGFNAVGGLFFIEIISVFYGRVDGIKVINYIYGFGGRDVKIDDIVKVYDRFFDIVKIGNVGEVYNYIGVRE